MSDMFLFNLKMFSLKYKNIFNVFYSNIDVLYSYGLTGSLLLSRETGMTIFRLNNASKTWSGYPGTSWDNLSGTITDPLTTDSDALALAHLLVYEFFEHSPTSFQFFPHNCIDKAHGRTYVLLTHHVLHQLVTHAHSCHAVGFSTPSVCFSHDVSKIDAARITKVDTETFHDESWKSIFGVKRSKVTSHKNIAGVGLICTLVSVGLHVGLSLPSASEFLEQFLVQSLTLVKRSHRQEDVAADELVDDLAVGAQTLERHLVVAVLTMQFNLHIQNTPAVHHHYRYPANNHHRLRGIASPVLTATGFVNEKGQFSTPHRIDTPQPITKIFVTGDYVGDPYGCAKLGAYPYMGGFWAHG